MRDAHIRTCRGILLALMAHISGVCAAGQQCEPQPWAQSHDEAGNVERGRVVAVDGAGNVIVAGPSGFEQAANIAIVKYSPAGGFLWEVLHDGPSGAFDDPRAIGVDANGTIYITAQTQLLPNFVMHWLTVAIDANGNFLWEKLFHGKVDFGSAEPHDLVVDHAGNIIVAGSSRGEGTLQNFAIVKYGPNGDELWDVQIASAGQFTDIAHAVTVDQQNNIYAAGRFDVVPGPNANIFTVKASPDGDVLWSDSYNDDEVAKSVDRGFSIALGPDDSVHVSGSSSDPASPVIGTVMRVLKYDNQGKLLWTRRNTLLRWGRTIAVDGKGTVFVAGDALNVEGSGLAAYDAAGNELWTNIVAGEEPENSQKMLALNPEGGVFMLMTENLGAGVRNVLLNAYAADGSLNCERIIDFDFTDDAGALDVDATGRIGIAGQTNPGSGDFDLLAIGIAANQNPADIDGSGAVDVDDLLAVINGWGACSDPENCPADIAPEGGDDVVDVDDLLAVISNWS